MYLKDDGLKNNLVNVNFVWIFPTLDFTSHSFALTRFIPILHDDLLAYSRIHGLGYSSYASQIDHMRMRIIIIIMSITLPKGISPTEIQNKLFLSLKNDVIKTISDEKLNILYEKERHVQKAVPMSTKNRANLLRTGLDYYGRVVDADKVKTEFQKITLADFKDWQHKLLEIPPAVIISGDVN